MAVGSLLRSQRDVVLEDQNCHTPSDAALDETRVALESHGVRALAMGLDVCSDGSVRSMHEAVSGELGPVDILVNAAGSSARKLMVDHPDELWHRMLDTNLNGPYRTIRRCLPGMMARGWGRIVNFASTAANVGYPMHSGYCASKSALLGLTRCVALEGAPRGVTCNAINPGFAATEQAYSSGQQEIDIAKLDLSVEEYQAQIAEGLPQKRYLAPKEVAALVGYLCTDEARGITSENVTMAMGSHW